MPDNKKKQKIRFFGKVLYWLVLAILILIAGITAISALNIPGNYKLLTVQSGSMEPAIKMGSIVMVKPTKEYQKGEVISFVDPNDPKYSITHRIFEAKEEGRILVTKGDANDAPDMGEVTRGQVLGKVFLTIPYLGYPVSFTKTPQGLILLVIIPAVIIIFGELQNIKNEIQRLTEKRKKEE